MILGVLLLGACVPDDLPVHHLVMGGDIMLGRRLNVALADPTQSPAIFARLAPQLRAADLAVANAEGVIALGGTYADKGEPRPHQHHAMAEAAAVLRDAGFDIVTMGNNHAGDYGPAALVEARDRLQAVGVDIAGAGQDLAEARTPAYRRVGDTVVAIVGAELTMAGKHAATADRAGIYHLDGADPARVEDVAADLIALAAEARAHAHLVVFSPHWGENFVTEPTPLMQQLAHALVDGGYDAILGHSAHVMHGVERYRGRPIVYDAGNLVADYGSADEAHQGMLYDLGFTRAGVVSLTALPIFLDPNSTGPATGRMAKTILDNWVARSTALGAPVTVRDGVGHLDCQPGGIEGPDLTVDPPTRRIPAQLRLAPTETVLEALPTTARPAAVGWEALGLHLLGSELLLDQLRIPKAGNIVRLYFRADGPLPADLMIRIGTTDTSPDSMDDHLPGDWLLPADRWPAGVIVQDRFLTRMLGKPSDEVTYRAGIVVGGRIVPPDTTDLPVVGGLVEIGRASWRSAAPGLFSVFGADPRSRLGG